jgi:tellurite methyltransferase
MSETTPASTPSGPKPSKAADFAATRDWPSYFRCMLGKPARETLLKALALFDKETPGPEGGARRAVDLGCGEGRDAFELLRRGWSVTAIDGHPMALELLMERVPSELRDRLSVELATFERATWGECDLLNASFSLPFCPPEHFPALWARVRASIRHAGRFCGQLFGDRDSWSVLPDRTHHARAALDALFAGFVLEELREEESLDTDCAGTPKHWHVFHVVARRV